MTFVNCRKLCKHSQGKDNILNIYELQGKEVIKMKKEKKRTYYGKIIDIPIKKKSYSCKGDKGCSCDSMCRDCGSQVSR